jgi:hypothetical protein
MWNARLKVAGLLMATVIVAAWGCGDGSVREDSSSEEATVSGTIKFKGKPLTKGEVTFSGGNTSRTKPPAKAAIGKDGSYSLKALVGQNMVEVDSPTISRAGPNMPQFSQQVQSGDNKIDIDLPR